MASEDQMNQIDPFMTSPLIGAYIGLMALILVNIFIALLSAIFERVHDKADGYTGLQRANEIVEIEFLLPKKYFIKSLILRLFFINPKCSAYWRTDEYNPYKDSKRKTVELSIEERMNNLESILVISSFFLFKQIF